MELRRETEDSKSYGSISEAKADHVQSAKGSVRKQHRAVLIFSAVVVGLVLVSVLVALVYKQTVATPKGPAGPLLYAEYGTAAVASDGAPCAKVIGGETVKDHC